MLPRLRSIRKIRLVVIAASLSALTKSVALVYSYYLTLPHYLTFSHPFSNGDFSKGLASWQTTGSVSLVNGDFGKGVQLGPGGELLDHVGGSKIAQDFRQDWSGVESVNLTMKVNFQGVPDNFRVSLIDGMNSQGPSYGRNMIFLELWCCAYPGEKLDFVFEAHADTRAFNPVFPAVSMNQSELVQGSWGELRLAYDFRTGIINADLIQSQPGRELHGKTVFEAATFKSFERLELLTYTICSSNVCPLPSAVRISNISIITTFS